MLKKPKYESHKLDELFVQKEVVLKKDDKEAEESKNLLKNEWLTIIYFAIDNIKL